MVPLLTEGGRQAASGRDIAGRARVRSFGGLRHPLGTLIPGPDAPAFSDAALCRHHSVPSHRPRSHHRPFLFTFAFPKIEGEKTK